MKQNVKNQKQYFKFQDEVVLFIADDVDYLRDNGVYEQNGKIGANVYYNGSLEVYGNKDKTYESNVTLTQNVKTKPTNVLCYIKVKSKNGFVLCRVVTPKARKDSKTVNIKTYEGYSEYSNSTVGILSVEYDLKENPDIFLEKLFKTVETSKNVAKENDTVKKGKINIITKAAHMTHKDKTYDYGQEM